MSAGTSNSLTRSFRPIQDTLAMRIPARFAPILFGALLSMVMVAIVSAFVLATSQGFHAGFVAQWAKSCMTTWPMAFVTVTLVAPLVRRAVAKLTA